jgi:hypothetical protein
MEATAAAAPSAAAAATPSQPATASCPPCTAPAPVPSELRPRPGSRFMACACGKGQGGLCKGQSVKSGGLRVPWGLPGSSEYAFRERTLIKLMGRQRFSEQKEQLMKKKDLQVHKAHYAENLAGGKTRLTPTKRGKHGGTARSLRKMASTNGPASMPVDDMMEATEQAMAAGTMPTQQRATRQSKRALEGDLGGAAAAAATQPDVEALSHAAHIAALKRELAERTAERDAAQV